MNTVVNNSKKIHSRIECLDYNDVVSLNTDNSMLQSAHSNIMFLTKQTEPFQPDNLFVYRIFLNNELFGICYGVLTDKTITYNVLFDSIDKSIQPHIYKSFVGNFIQAVINNTCKRVLNQELYTVNETTLIIGTNNVALKIDFQIDLPDEFTLFSDYAFLTKSPYYLTGSKKIFSLSVCNKS